MQVSGLSTGDSTCGQPGYKPRSASTVVDPTAVVHRCPPAIHRISTGFVPRAVDSVGTLPARRPQNLQQEIHTLPQAVDRDVTLRVCPHRFPQGRSTSVGNGRGLSTAGDNNLWTSCGLLWITLARNGPVLTLTIRVSLWVAPGSVSRPVVAGLGITGRSCKDGFWDAIVIARIGAGGCAIALASWGYLGCPPGGVGPRRRGLVWGQGCGKAAPACGVLWVSGSRRLHGSEATPIEANFRLAASGRDRRGGRPERSAVEGRSGERR